jgi:rare lipoprotein A
MSKLLAIAVALLSCPALAAQEDDLRQRGLEAVQVQVQVQQVQEPAQEVVRDDARPEIGRGLASWYGPRFHGRRTASGEKFDMHQFTAAHPTLPFGTIVRVRSLVNGRTVDVRINDRGPFLRHRVIDLSRAAAQALGLIDARTGTKPVVISAPRPND